MILLNGCMGSSASTMCNPCQYDGKCYEKCFKGMGEAQRSNDTGNEIVSFKELNQTVDDLKKAAEQLLEATRELAEVVHWNK